jgi:SAM-dependent methyltransferase
MNGTFSQIDSTSRGVCVEEPSNLENAVGSGDRGGCPACQSKAAAVVQCIDLMTQHCQYSDDEMIQRRLTTLAEVPNDRVEMVQCNLCGLEYADPLLAPSAEWYDLVYGTLDLYPAKRWEFDFVLNTMAAGESLGELGCGSGEFLRLCRQAGIPASGVDFSQQAVDACIRAGLDAKRIDLKNETADFPNCMRPEVIVAFQVLEHLENPRALFTWARKWVAPHGKLWIAVPSDRRPSRFMGERDFLDEPPHHMTRWTKEALNRVADGIAWQCRRVIYEPIDWPTKIWWISTRSSGYKRLQRAGLLNNRWLERSARTILAPFAWLRCVHHGSSISGQTMLAEYARTDEQIAS